MRGPIVTVPAVAIVFPLESSVAELELRGIDSPRTALDLGAWVAGDAVLYSAFMAGLLAAQPRPGGVDENAFAAIVEQLAPEKNTSAEMAAVVFHGLLQYAAGCTGCSLVLSMMRAVEWASTSGGDGVCHAFSRGAEVALCGADAGRVPSGLHHADDCPGRHRSCSACGAMLWASAHRKGVA